MNERGFAESQKEIALKSPIFLHGRKRRPCVRGGEEMMEAARVFFACASTYKHAQGAEFIAGTCSVLKNDHFRESLEEKRRG